MSVMKRKHISSRVRQKIWEKYGGKCAYCGEPIPFKGMHVDHLIPLARGGADSDDNYMPACSKCNHYKHTLTFDDFREQIGLLTGRLRERVYIYKLALRHGRISESSEPVIFYFEQLTKDKNGATQ